VLQIIFGELLTDLMADRFSQMIIVSGAL